VKRKLARTMEKYDESHSRLQRSRISQWKWDRRLPTEKLQ